jgi:signal transduction histidine kinase
LRQGFGNLIGNAFGAIRRGGIIYLRARNATDPSSHQPGVGVTVVDTGHGMDKQTVERLSEPFFTTKGNNGTGLGIWISYDILQQHQTIMRVRSRCNGNKTGTIFSIFSLSMACNKGGPSSPKNGGPQMSADIVRAASRNLTVKAESSYGLATRSVA